MCAKRISVILTYILTVYMVAGCSRQKAPTFTLKIVGFNCNHTIDSDENIFFLIRVANPGYDSIKVTTDYAAEPGASNFYFTSSQNKGRMIRMTTGHDNWVVQKEGKIFLRIPEIVLANYLNLKEGEPLAKEIKFLSSTPFHITYTYNNVHIDIQKSGDLKIGCISNDDLKSW